MSECHGQHDACHTCYIINKHELPTSPAPRIRGYRERHNEPR